MAAPYEQLLANLRAFAMASPEVVPVYDTSPSHTSTTPAPSRPREVETIALHRSISTSSEPLPLYDSSPLHESSTVSSRVVSMRTVSLTSSQPRPVAATSHGKLAQHSQSQVHNDGCNSSLPTDAYSRSALPLSSKPSVRDQKLRINSPFSVIAMHDVFSTFGSEKRALLDSIGLGGLLKVHKQRLQCRNLILQLLSNMDPKTGSIKLKSGELKMADRDVNIVLGIPYVGQEVNLSSRCPAVIHKLKEVLLIDSHSDITIDTVQAILFREYGRKMNSQERDAFKVAAIIFADCCFLGPRGCTKRTINKDILEHVADPSNITKINWSGYVLKVLKSSAYRVQQSLIAGNKTILIEGCHLFLLVFYLDNLNFGYMTPRHDIFPRIATYTPRLLAELVSYDRVSNAAPQTLQFGRRKIRPCQEVSYSRCNSKEAAKTRSNETYLQPSSPRNEEVDTCQTSSGIHPQLDDHFNTLQMQALVQEYLQDFTTQIHRCTDELRRKFVFFLINCVQNAASSSSAVPGFNEKTNTADHQAVKSTNLASKSPKSRQNVTIISSSNGSTKNINRDTSANVNLKLNVDCTSSELLHEDLQGKSINQAHPRKECVFSTDCQQYIMHEYFPSSPFQLKLKDKEIPVKTIIEIIRILPKISIDERNMNWYIHDVPTKLEIAGENLHVTFYKEANFSIDIMTAVMRLYQELDDVMYQGCTENRWRHYLPPQWVNRVMTDQRMLHKGEIEEMFSGEHIIYKVQECSMVFVPVCKNSEWSLYAWNFLSKTVTIIDPVEKSLDILHQKHEATIGYLHEAMVACRQEFLGCSDDPKTKWSQTYLIDTDGCSRLTKSGLYTAFYARYFDGVACTQTMLMDDSVTLFQTTLLCQLLGSHRNKGTYPLAINDAMDIM